MCPTLDAALPNLFVIGAPKAGTTSLHAYLTAHPEVSMSSAKEPMVFTAPDYRERLGAYAQLLDPGAPIRGESSATYSQYPQWPSVPERIAAAVPGARFIYLVRDPVERALAHYRQHLRDGKEDRDTGAAFADPEPGSNPYVAASLYATQLRRYLAHFGPERLLVIASADLARDRDPTMARIFTFLGVDPDFRSPAFGAELNTADRLRSPTRLGALISGDSALRRVPLPAPLRRLARGIVSRPIEAGPLPDATHARLRSLFGPELEWLHSEFGVAMDGWTA